MMQAFAAVNGSTGKKVWNALYDCRTIGCAVNKAVEIFRGLSVPEPNASAEYLAVSAFRMRARSQLFQQGEALGDAGLLKEYAFLCQERQEKRTPVQYLTGEWDFHSINLKLRPPVLIPRPETEELVEHVLDDTQMEITQNSRIVDVGCGSGALILALLKSQPLWTGVAIDPSLDAVNLCKENARRLSLTSRCHVILSSIEEWDSVDDEHKYDLLVSNPPYIAENEMSTLEPEVVWHEDHNALCGGKDGLNVIRCILRKAPSLIKKGGVIWIEADASHPTRISKMVRDERIFPRIRYESTYNDFSGNERFCKLRVH